MVATESSRVELLHKVKFSHLSDDHWNFVCAECERLRVDPSTVWVKLEPSDDTGELEPKIIMTLDAMRSMSGKSGLGYFEGRVELCGSDGKWVDVWTDDVPPVAARAQLFRVGSDVVIEGIAYAKQCASYRLTDKNVPMLTAAWERGFAPMLAKCAKVAAYRQAHSELLGCVSAKEENEPDSLPKFSRAGWPEGITPNPGGGVQFSIPDDPKVAWRHVDDSTPDNINRLRLMLMDLMTSAEAADEFLATCRRKYPRLVSADDLRAFAAVVLATASGSSE